MIEYESRRVEIHVGCEGIVEPAVVSWHRRRETPGGPPLFDLVVTARFGEVKATATDVFGALQDVRRQLEPAGWRFAVEGARPQSRAVGIQRDQGDGLIVTRLGERGGMGRGLFDPISLDESGTVAEQEAVLLTQQKFVRTQIVRDDWRSLESLASLNTEWESFDQLPTNIRLATTSERVKSLSRGWRGVEFTSDSGRGILAVAPEGTDWDTAVNTVRAGGFDLEVPPILVVIAGSEPSSVRQALADWDA